MHPKTLACHKCGFHPLSGDKYCQSCAAETQHGQVQCVQCGERLLSKEIGSQGQEPDKAPQTTRSGHIDPETRRERLSSFVRQASVAGWTVESSSDFDVVLVGGKRCNHLVHGLVTILGGVVSCGVLFFWGIIWLTLGLTQKEDRLIIHINEYGKAEYRLVTK